MNEVAEGRHVLLAEVGPHGRALLERARVPVPEGRAGDAAARYLERMGVRVERDGAPEPFPHHAAFSHPAPREFAAGAFLALREVRRLLGLEPTPGASS